MSDDIKNEALQELAEQATEVEQVEEVQPTPDEQPEQQQTKAPSQSFKELRTKNEDLEKRMYEQERFYRQELERARVYQQPQQVQQPQEPELGDTDIVEYRHVKKEFNRLKSELDQLKQQSEIQRLQTKYSDIDTIVSMQNLEKLKQVDPEAYMAVEAAPTLYAKGVLAYKLIKSSDIITKPNDDYDYEQAAINRNAQKPKSISTVQPQRGTNPLTKANAFANGPELTPELQKSLLEEMENSIKSGRR